jgi:hypothetical protein
VPDMREINILLLATGARGKYSRELPRPYGDTRLLVAHCGNAARRGAARPN